MCLCSAVCKTNEQTSLNHLTILQQNNLILAKGGRVPQKNAHITQNAPTNTVRTAVQKKNNTYIYFMDVLNSGRHEDNHAKFYPAVLSHSGEFSEGLSELLELNYVEFKRALSKAPERRDSRTTRVQAREAKTLTNFFFFFFFFPQYLLQDFPKEKEKQCMLVHSAGAGFFVSDHTTDVKDDWDNKVQRQNWCGTLVVL